MIVFSFEVQKLALQSSAAIGFMPAFGVGMVPGSGLAESPTKVLCLTQVRIFCLHIMDLNKIPQLDIYELDTCLLYS